MWALRVLPELGMRLEEKDIPNIKEIIGNAAESVSLGKGREEVRKMCLSHSGESSKLVVDYLVRKKKSLREMKGND